MPVVPWDGTPLFGGKTIVIPGAQTTHMFEGGANSPVPDEVAVSAIDRTGNESRVTIAAFAKRLPVKRSQTGFSTLSSEAELMQ